MKKIFLVVLCLLGIKGVNALENVNVNISKDITNICDNEGNIYPIYKIDYLSMPIYFINLSDNYNLDFNDYNPIEYIYSNELLNYIESDLSDNSYHNLSVYMMLWEKLYPDKTFRLCSSYLNNNYDYLENKKKLKSVSGGPLPNNTIELNEGDIYSFESPYFYYFYRDDSENINVDYDGNNINIYGEKGIYNIIFYRKTYGIDDGHNLYSDGKNTILINTKGNNNIYKYKVIIGYKKVELTLKDDEGNPLEGICFNVNNEKVCSDNNGYVSTYVDERKCNIFIEEEKFDKYEENLDLNEDVSMDIVLNKKEEVKGDDISIKEEAPNKQDDTQDYSYITLENTMTISFSLLGLLIAYYVKK